MNVETFMFDNFYINSSLNEETIYIKFTDNIKFIVYDSFLKKNDLNLNFTLPEIYQIIVKCFKKEDNSTIETILDENILKIKFNALIGGILNIIFEIELKEKILFNNVQLTTDLNRMEYNCSYLMQKFDELSSYIEKDKEENKLLMDLLSNAEIFLGANHKKGHLFIPINITELELDNSYIILHWNKLSKFYCLKKLIITNLNIKFDQFEIQSLEEIEIYGSETTSISGIQKNQNLKKLTLSGLSSLSQYDFLLYIKECKKITNLIVKSCDKFDMNDIQLYCQLNNIELEFS